MGYTKVDVASLESVMDAEYGNMWFLRQPLGADELGLSIMELAPGSKGKAHDHAHDGQEEIYCVVDGEVTVTLGAETVTVGRHQALRVDPAEHRQLENRGDVPARVVIAGAP